MELKADIVGDVAVVQVPAESLDTSNAADFKREMSPIITSHSKVVFDMSGLSFVDSSGLGAILSCLPKLRAAGGDLKICCITRQIQILFELVRMHRLFDIFKSRDEAVAAFQKQG